MTSPRNDPLFGSGLWQAALEKYGSAAHLTVKLFGADQRVVFGPIHPTPLFQLFDESGHDPGLFAECARQCLAQTEKRPAVLVSQFHGLAVVGASLVLEGEIVGAAVGGYALVDFSQVSEVQRLARQSDLGFEQVWKIARKQPPVPQQRLMVHGELLQVLGDALLRENYRTRQYEQAAAIVKSSDDAIIGLDLNGVITSWNDGAQRLFGYVPEEAIGKPITILLPPDRQDEEPAILERVLEGEKVDHYETVRQRKDGTLADISLTVSLIRDAEGNVAGASKIARDISELRRQQQHRELLIGELNHRVKNTLATVQSLAMQTLRNAKTLSEGADAFNARLLALSKAHDVLTREQWQGANLHEVVAGAMAAYSDKGQRTRVRFEGVDIRLQPRASLALSMALHELATNAVKYGALSNDLGIVNITCRVSQSGTKRFQFRWVESEGPPVIAPRKRGFGSRLIQEGLRQDFAGEIEMEFAAPGLICTIDAPLDEVALGVVPSSAGL